MLFDIEPDSPVPIYEQIVARVTFAIAAGDIGAGALIPSVRELADKLIVNPNTVARAYRELEMAGVVEKRRTAGTYVSDAGSPLARRERVKILTERVDALLAEARQMGIDLDDLIRLIHQRHDVMQPFEERTESS